MAGRQLVQSAAPDFGGTEVAANMHYVYMLYSESLGKHYIGIASDIERRIRQHNSALKGFTRVGRPWVLVHTEVYQSKSEAPKREKYLKRMKSARFIRELIHSTAQ